MAKEPKTSTKDNPLVRALSRWENEGGRADTDWAKRAALVEEEEHILQCLGTAVVTGQRAPTRLALDRRRRGAPSVQRAALADGRAVT